MYTISVVQPDLRHEETIIQAATALDSLQMSITNIFDRIDKRISNNNAKINELHFRINSASLRIQTLPGNNKSIKMFSPAKFPSSHVFKTLALTFEGSKTITNVCDYEVEGRADPTYNNVQEKLVFFHFRGAKSKSGDALVSSHHDFSAFPTNVKYVNSVLLYNKSEIVFSNQRENNEGETFRPDRGQISKNAKNIVNCRFHIEPAPFSLSNRKKGTEKRSQHSIFYTPILNDAPVIDLPLDLPDLPGIVDDIQFSHADNYQIAPSMFIENFSDLPELVENTLTESKFIHSGVSLNNEVSALMDSKSMPPDQVMLAIPTVPESNISVPPPPPPPPPQPLQPTEMESPNSKHKNHFKIQANPVTDMRSNLMDAIRKAGGARGGGLRAAADVVQQPTNDKLGIIPDKLKKTNSGDLMADLHDKLLLRRKGISGLKIEETKSANCGNVISLLSAVIPPPPSKAQYSSSDDEGDDEDWVD